MIRPDGTAEIVFLGIVHGREFHGTFKGHDWIAHEATGEDQPNEVATAFASSLGWKGGALHGAVVFTGMAPACDVSGVLVSQVLRFLGDVALS